MLSAVFGTLTAKACPQPEIEQFKLCHGDRVYSAKGETGIVRGVFLDGKVAVKLDDFIDLKKIDSQDLAVVRGCAHKENFCVGDAVVTEEGRRGVIRGIFPTGEVSVKVVDDFGLNKKFRISQLATQRSCSLYGKCVTK